MFDSRQNRHPLECEWSSSKRLSSTLGLLAMITFVGCGDSSLPSVGEMLDNEVVGTLCTPAAAGSDSPSYVKLRERPHLCIPVLGEEVVVLRSDSASGVDPTFPVTVTAEGRFVTATHSRDRIAFWDRDGNLTSTYGRSGQGPNEFQNMPRPFADDSGNVWITSPPRLVMLGPEDTVRREVRDLTVHPLYASATDWGLLTVQTVMPAPDEPYFRVRHFVGNGADDALERVSAESPEERAKLFQDRRVAYIGDGRYAAAPLNEYRIEIRSLSEGHVERTLVRDVGWFKPHSNQPEVVLPTLLDLKFSNGFLWVRLALVESRFLGDDIQINPATGRVETLAYQYYWEAIDLGAGLVVARVGADAARFGDFVDDGLVYWYRQTESGSEITIYSLQLADGVAR